MVQIVKFFSTSSLSFALHIFVIGSLPESLINFRGELIKSLVAGNHKVTVMSAFTDAALANKIEALGVNFIGFPITRNSQNPCFDVQTFFALYTTLKKTNPDVVLAYTIKPVIWGGLAARLARIKFNALITGLGFTFQGGGVKRECLRGLVCFLYRIALKNAVAVIFQNTDNRLVFVGSGIVAKDITHVVAGSGVDINYFQFSLLPKDNFTFLCVARLLAAKGLREYAKAASIVKLKYPEISFKLVGPKDDSPDKIDLKEVNTWLDTYGVEYLGSTNDVRPYIEQCHVYVLPSHHEGMPRSVLEAMSMGRPILTTDAVGCRETVENGINGFKVPVGDYNLLAERMLWFVENKAKLSVMGVKSREMVEKNFDVRFVNNELIKIMKLEPT